ncbi:hypothetical protein TcCL_ESM04857 [Trypanosoma cruzi]|nr:hypothetical protein TcCL_ESM04857 [Trypanosoma cruzi]
MPLLRVVVPIPLPFLVRAPILLLLVTLPVERLGHLLQRHQLCCFYLQDYCRHQTHQYPEILELLQNIHHRRHRNTAHRGHIATAGGQSPSSSRLHTQSREGQREEDEKNTQTHQQHGNGVVIT